MFLISICFVEWSVAHRDLLVLTLPFHTRGSSELEAMGERRVTVGRQTYALPSLFLVMATQNPIEQEGTFPLPEAQLDRFLMYVRIGYPAADAEGELLRLARERARQGLPVAPAAADGTPQDAGFAPHARGPQ